PTAYRPPTFTCGRDQSRNVTVMSPAATRSRNSRLNCTAATLRLEQLVDPCRLTCLVVALGQVGRVASRVRVQTGRDLEVAGLLVEVRGDGFPPRYVPVDRGQRREPGGCAVRLPDGHRAVQPDDRRVAEPEQLVVPLDDLDPVGVLDPRRVGVERGD